MTPCFFTPAEFRTWLEANHETETEILIGFYKRGTGRENMTWPESVQQALCFGWIDGLRKSLGEESYTIRFTPRKPGSIWSNVNLAHIEKLTQAGLMHPAGIRAYAARKPDKTGIYSFERKDHRGLSEERLAVLKKNRSAWTWFSRQAPSFRKVAGYWVESAKQAVTREKRLQILIECAERGEPPPPYRFGSVRKKKA